MPQSLTTQQTTAVYQMLKTYTDLTETGLNNNGGWAFLRVGPQSTINLLRATKLPWLSNNAQQAVSDINFADKWYGEAKSVEHTLMNTSGWVYKSALGTVDIALKKGSGINYLSTGQVVNVGATTIKAAVTDIAVRTPPAIGQGIANVATWGGKAIGQGVTFITSIPGKILAGVPWYIWAMGAGVLVIVGVVAVKGARR